ncbi:MAG: hypothetical protein KC492_20680, partial [Myxococcales bacterium]|nr:hypothetical protein [Myxococcales bacterium]
CERSEHRAQPGPGLDSAEHAGKLEVSELGLEPALELVHEIGLAWARVEDRTSLTLWCVR